MRTLEERYDLISRFAGHPNAYALLQPEMEYFDGPEGFLAYRTAFFRDLVLNDPVAEPSGLDPLIRRFLAERPGTVFVNISQPFAGRLHALGLGYRFSPYGTERILDLEVRSFLSNGKVAGALKKARKGGLVLEELDLGTTRPEVLEELALINREFLDQTRPRREITFISRPVELRPRPGVRFFVMREKPTGRFFPFGFLVLDPFFEGGALVGYQLNAIRFRKTRIWGVYYAVVADLASRLAAEGLRRLSLGGLAYDLADEPSPFPHDDKIVRRLRLLRRFSDRFYMLSHFTDVKLELAGSALRMYLAIPPDGSVTRTVVRFARVSGLA